MMTKEEVKKLFPHRCMVDRLANGFKVWVSMPVPDLDKIEKLFPDYQMEWYEDDDGFSRIYLIDKSTIA